MSESRGSSPGPSPRSVVGTYGLETIPIQWDNDAEVRERIRSGKNLCLSFSAETGKGESGYVQGTAEDLKVNACVIKPLAFLMGSNDLLLPPVEKLIAAVEEFYQIAKLSRTVQQAYQEAWAMRRMIQKLKRYTYRPLPPQDRNCKKSKQVCLSETGLSRHHH